LQAEDGIRFVGRSRVLGDVYKGQSYTNTSSMMAHGAACAEVSHRGK